MESKAFNEWELRPELIDRLGEQNIYVPTDVQTQCWEAVTAGRDLLVQSRTGTGKTLAFALPLLQKMEQDKGDVEVLVVLPTRELAMQVANDFRKMGAAVGLLYGGGSYSEQLGSLRGGVRFVVGTPGRICDHIDRGSLKLNHCRALVLDEADETLDMGFADELDRIFAVLPKSRQTLLFSATMPKQMEELASKTLHEPERIAVSSGLAVASDIRHAAYEVDREHRLDALENVLHVTNPELAIIFCHTKLETEELAERLRIAGFQAAALNGDMAQAERTRTLNLFRRRQLRFLVATDVAARGLDVRGITHVFNLSVPKNAETYIHRVGRTGRAGDKGVAITFLSPRDSYHFRDILRAADIKIEMRAIPQTADVKRALHEAFHGNLCDKLAGSIDPGIREMAKELLGYMEPADAVTALLAGDPTALALLSAGFEVPLPKQRKNRERSARLGQAAPTTAFVQVNVGHREGYEAGILTKLLSEATGLGKNCFTNIDIKANSSNCEVPIELTEAVIAALNGYPLSQGSMKARKVARPKASRVDRPQHSARAGRGRFERASFGGERTERSKERSRDSYKERFKERKGGSNGFEANSNDFEEKSNGSNYAEAHNAHAKSSERRRPETAGKRHPSVNLESEALELDAILSAPKVKRAHVERSQPDHAKSRSSSDRSWSNERSSSGKGGRRSQSHGNHRSDRRQSSSAPTGRERAKSRNAVPSRGSKRSGRR